MCLDWIAQASSFFTLWSLTFFWVEQFMSLQNIVGGNATTAAVIRRRGSLDDTANFESESFQQQGGAVSSSVYYSGSKPQGKSVLGKMRLKFFKKANIFIVVIFWSMVILVSAVCFIACMLFIFTNMSYESMEFGILRLVYRVSLSIICAMGIAYFGLKISIVFRNQYSKLLIKIAIITAVCSCSYMILSMWNVISFILYRVGRMARDSSFFTLATVIIFSIVELVANGILLFALTPDTLLCCCQNVKERRRVRTAKRHHDGGATDFFNDETESVISNDLGEQLLRDEDDDDIYE
eukprot:CAMPEP_0117446766 /NCGR_PEP_ID=MMETSP0759-20121206/6517_1 /TAXON_ID=63605 /ORGANISM="Percolomonas cosmopolitus, Strain WS" /LENGTH=294 /DNA_ID=CAMNT_0005239057 /DNA_START=639 /DNA_END=1523 /DNA_ORIENTATION=+